MYNRYLRNDDGIYTRVPMQDPPRDEPPRQPPHGNAPPPPPPEPPPCGESPGQEASQFFSRLLDKLPLKGVDKADLLLRTPPPRLSPLSCPCTSCLREAKSTAAAVLFVLLFLVVEAAVAVALKLGICDLLAKLPAHTDVVLGLLEAAGALQIAL